VYEGHFDVINVSVISASTIFSLTHSAIKTPRCHIFQSECIGRRYSKKGKRHAHCPILKMSANGASMMFEFASWKIQRAVRRHQPIIELSAAFLGEGGCVNDGTIF